MSRSTRSDYLTRDSVLRELSDDEIAAVATAETAERLTEGEEFVDLGHLDRGVSRATAATAPMGRVLPKRAVREATWTKIVSYLASSPVPRGAAASG
jgi:hypothetical protein